MDFPINMDIAAFIKFLNDSRLTESEYMRMMKMGAEMRKEYYACGVDVNLVDYSNIAILVNKAA